MKFVVIQFFLLLTLVNADEVDRIESIVQDINTLKENYTLTKEKLKSEKKINSEYMKKINSLKKEINLLEKELKTKHNNRKNIEQNNISKSKNQIKIKKYLNNKIKNDENNFPKLALKSKYKTKDKEKVEHFKASTFRVNKTAKIYESINGKIVDEWEESRSFTSHTKSATWIKITGYFINKIWTPAESSLWIKSEDATLRVE